MDSRRPRGTEETTSSRAGMAWHGLLVLAAFGSVFGYAMNTPAMQAAMGDPVGCLLREPARQFSFLPDAVNGGLCGFLSTMQSMTTSSDAARLCLKHFGDLFFISFIILGYDSFRSKLRGQTQTRESTVIKRGLWFMMAGQVISAAAALPLYFGLAARARIGENPNYRPEPEQIYSILLATLLGFYLPNWNTERTGWSHESLALWQIHPLFVIALNAIFPALLRPFFPRSSSTSLPIYAILATTVYLSAKAHFEVFSLSSVSFSDVFLPFGSPANAVNDMHRFFAFDYAIALLALVSHLIATARIGLNYERWILTATWIGCAVLVGPSGATAIIWAAGELLGPASRVDSRKAL